MSDLSSSFSRDDIETLLEAMGDWEALGNQEFHVMQMIRNAPMPPEDHEAHEAFAQIKEHFKRREKEIKNTRMVKQEKAVFLKAKLMLVRKDMGISQLFEMATNADERPPEAPADQPQAKEKAARGPDKSQALEDAEFYIKDMGKGVWDFYQKFLAERRAERNS